jgi:hypothetical protein|nr:hypothetical protein [Kofleriaceae bacterium]
MDLDPTGVQPDAHIWERAKRWAFERTVAIYIRKPDGSPKQWGSGVLVKFGEAAFLVTASHVMTIMQERVEILLGAMTPNARGLVSLGEQLVIRSEEDKLDLAIARLPARAVDELARAKAFVQHAAVDIERLMPQGRYLVVGYPIEITQTDHTMKTITIGQFTHTTMLTNSDSAHPGISIAVANHKDSIARDREGGRARPPDLHGVSGCGIWRLWANDQAGDLDQWDETWIRLVGIEHRTVGEAIIGTMASHFFEMALRTQPTEVTLSPSGVTVRFP